MRLGVLGAPRCLAPPPLTTSLTLPAAHTHAHARVLPTAAPRPAGPANADALPLALAGVYHDFKLAQVRRGDNAVGGERGRRAGLWVGVYRDFKLAQVGCVWGEGGGY